MLLCRGALGKGVGAGTSRGVPLLGARGESNGGAGGESPHQRRESPHQHRGLPGWPDLEASSAQPRSVSSRQSTAVNQSCSSGLSSAPQRHSSGGLLSPPPRPPAQLVSIRDSDTQDVLCREAWVQRQRGREVSLPINSYRERQPATCSVNFSFFLNK